jgi:hypothetical protein
MIGHRSKGNPIIKRPEFEDHSTLRISSAQRFDKSPLSQQQSVQISKAIQQIVQKPSSIK